MNYKTRNHTNSVYNAWLKWKHVVRKTEGIERLGGKCEQCRETSIEKLQFHHIDKTTKEIKPCKFAQVSYARFIKELNKCQLLCARCHTFLHNEEKGFACRVAEEDPEWVADPEWVELWEDIMKT